MSRKYLPALLLAAFAALPASANVILLANGSVNGSSAGVNTDLSGLSGPLENGIPGNFLGGLGSGVAYAGHNIFLATPDRGPNATPYNSAVDDTTSYIARFHTLKLSLVAGAGGSLPFALSTKLTGTTLLSSKNPLNYGTGAGLDIGSGVPGANSAGLNYFTGRSDNYGAGGSRNASNARFDPESVRVSNDGRSVFISDEYGPYVRQFNRQTGSLIKTFALPGNLDVANLSPNGATEISGNTSGRVANKGMEGLAITPDGKTLVGIMQAPLIQDAADSKTKKMVRIVTIDIATGTTHEYGYNLTSGSGVSDIVAVSNTQFLVDERDGKGLGDGSNAAVKQAFTIDLASATDITGLSGAAASAAVVGKTEFLDIVTALTANGLSTAQVPAKIEGFAFGQDVSYLGGTYHTLFVANDNDFVPGIAGPNQFFVFGFQDSDLPNFIAQGLAGSVPEPSTWLSMIAGFAIVGTLLRRRRGSAAVA